MKTRVEERYPEMGFVYTNRTRMLFTRLRFHTRNEADADNPTLVLAASNWAEPTEDDLAQCIAALRDEYGHKRPIMVDGQEGLVPV